MKIRALASLSALLVLVLGARPSRAEPSIWQRARQPAAARQQLILNRIERLLSSIGLPEFDAELSAGAIALFQLEGMSAPCLADGGRTRAAAPAGSELDARLAYLLAGALLDSHAEREAEARCLLQRALRDAPESPLAAAGLANLANAAAKLGDRAAERAANEAALDRTWEPDMRANLIANLAESEMALGDLRGAIRDYRLALQSSQRAESVSAAYFGLAVALDRSGDLPSALVAAKNAISVQLPPSRYPARSVLDLPNVFFTPSYEVHYYQALGAMASAELGKDVVARRAALAEAAEHWSAYLSLAKPDHAPWAARAALHQANVARQVSALTAQLPRPEPRTTGADPDFL